MKPSRTFSLVALLLPLLAGAQRLPQRRRRRPLAAPGAASARAIFAGGCFWCVESDFDKVDGVLSTTSGYTGGTRREPELRAGVGQAEPAMPRRWKSCSTRAVSYEKLVEHFWRTIDPTTPDRQFCDAGTPYRTRDLRAWTTAQLKVAQASRGALEKSKPFKEPIVTEIVPAAPSTRPRNTTRTTTRRIRSATSTTAMAAGAMRGSSSCGVLRRRTEAAREPGGKPPQRGSVDGQQEQTARRPTHPPAGPSCSHRDTASPAITSTGTGEDSAPGRYRIFEHPGDRVLARRAHHDVVDAQAFGWCGRSAAARSPTTQCVWYGTPACVEQRDAVGHAPLRPGHGASRRGRWRLTKRATWRDSCGCTFSRCSSSSWWRRYSAMAWRTARKRVGRAVDRDKDLQHGVFLLRLGRGWQDIERRGRLAPCGRCLANSASRAWMRDSKRRWFLTKPPTAPAGSPGRPAACSSGVAASQGCSSGSLVIIFAAVHTSTPAPR